MRLYIYIYYIELVNNNIDVIDKLQVECRYFSISDDVLSYF